MCVLFFLNHHNNGTENMGAIVSRRKRTTVIASQSAPASSSHTTAHAVITPSVPSDQASNQPTHGSHDYDRGKSEESDHSDTDPESNDGEEQSDHNSTRSVSISSKSNESVKDTSSTHEISGKKSSIDEASSDEEFTKAWRKALLEDLDISISDNVKIVRIFTSSTFTGTHELERCHQRDKTA